MGTLQPGEAGAIADQRAETFISRYPRDRKVKSIRNIRRQYGVSVSRGDDPARSYGQLAQKLNRLLSPQA